jgi:hypothetical protein
LHARERALSSQFSIRFIEWNDACDRASLNPQCESRLSEGSRGFTVASRRKASGNADHFGADRCAASKLAEQKFPLEDWHNRRPDGLAVFVCREFLMSVERYRSSCGSCASARRRAMASSRLLYRPTLFALSLQRHDDVRYLERRRLTRQRKHFIHRDSGPDRRIAQAGLANSFLHALCSEFSHVSEHRSESLFSLGYALSFAAVCTNCAESRSSSVRICPKNAAPFLSVVAFRCELNRNTDL